MIGQPFDLLKVRIQTAPQGTYKGTLKNLLRRRTPFNLFKISLCFPFFFFHLGVLDCAKQVLAKEGPLAFYKVSLQALTLSKLLWLIFTHPLGFCMTGNLDTSNRSWSLRFDSIRCRWETKERIQFLESQSWKAEWFDWRSIVFGWSFSRDRKFSGSR